MDDKKTNHKKHLICPTQICQDIKIDLPVEVNASANVGHIQLNCKSRKIVEDSKTVKHVSKFDVVQEISARIPIEFVAEVEVKDERVDFGKPHECK